MPTTTHYNPLDPLQSAIVEILLKTPGLTVNDLLLALRELYGLEYTRQHLYKVIGKMVECSMLSKVRGKLSVEMRWVTRVHKLFSDAICIMPEKKDFAVDFRLKEGQSREFIADSFQAITSLWDKVSIQLIEQNAKLCHQFMSHAYFCLLSLAARGDFYAFLDKQNFRYFTLIGSNTFLDRHAVELYTLLQHHKSSINTVLPFDRDGYVLEVVGDYIAELKVPPTVEMHFTFMFEHVDSLEKFDQHLFADIFKIKAPFQLVITRNNKDAAKLRTAIEKAF